MQTYINEYHPGFITLKTVKPDVKKVFIKNILIVFSVTLGIIALLFYLNSLVGLDVFLIPFEALGMEVGTEGLLLNTILIFLGAAVIFIIFNYLAVINIRYEFYNDHMKIYEPVLWVFITNSEVPYKNIVKISYNYTGLTNKLLNSGEIVIELTGMEDGSVTMQVIDDTEQVVDHLLKIVKDYNAVQQMQFEENYKINNIMRKF
jgi:hypothetical protein